MSTTLLSAGVACLIAAVIGGGMKAFGVEIPVLKSVRRQAATGLLGLALAIAAFLVPNPDSRAGPPATTATGNSRPESSSADNPDGRPQPAPPNRAAPAPSAGVPSANGATDGFDASTISATSDEGFEVVEGVPPAIKSLPGLGTVDKPQPIDLGVTYQFTLEDLDVAYLGVPPVTGVLIVLDMRSRTGESTNLQSDLSVLDRDGAVLITRAIHFNEIDRGYRRVGIFPVKVRAPLGLKLNNGGKPMVYSLTLFGTARIPFVPLFGRVTPKAMVVSESAAGALDAGEEVFYRIPLKKGNYRAILDFANTPRDQTNIIGYLAVLDAAGGDQTQVLRLNEVDVAFRKTGAMVIKREGPAILRIQTEKAVRYTVRIVPDQ